MDWGDLLHTFKSKEITINFLDDDKSYKDNNETFDKEDVSDEKRELKDYEYFEEIPNDVKVTKRLDGREMSIDLQLDV
jgi:hypothetical protein